MAVCDGSSTAVAAAVPTAVISGATAAPATTPTRRAGRAPSSTSTDSSVAGPREEFVTCNS
jgi:hypothetical protein